MDLLQKELLSTAVIPEDPEEILGATEQLKQVLMMYSCAIREVKTKLEVLNDELSIKNSRNPIEFITSRVKQPLSIVQKLHRKGFEVSLASVQENLNDVAGIRVICSFVDDIYAVEEMLTKQDDVTLIEVKDYIKNPKPNGYRSLHLIIEIPVFFSDSKTNLRVEVQIRTIAMDFWASLEHELKYKKEIPDVEEIQGMLKECADTISDTDRKMMEIRDMIEIRYSEMNQNGSGGYVI
jgi:putative GTP pyrophosphokinase